MLSAVPSMLVYRCGYGHVPALSEVGIHGGVVKRRACAEQVALNVTKTDSFTLGINRQTTRSRPTRLAPTHCLSPRPTSHLPNPSSNSSRPYLPLRLASPVTSLPINREKISRRASTSLNPITSSPLVMVLSGYVIATRSNRELR
eukprot:965940-Rhodomonas_salina.2